MNAEMIEFADVLIDMTKVQQICCVHGMIMRCFAAMTDRMRRQSQLRWYQCSR